MKKILLLQYVLCVLVLITSILLCSRSHEKAVSAGTFGTNVRSNNTLEDFSNNLFAEMLL